TCAPAAPCAWTGAPRASSSWARWERRPQPATPTSAPTPTATATGCASVEASGSRIHDRLHVRPAGTQGDRERPLAKTMEGRSKAADKANELVGKVQGSQAWNSIFRPGSVFRKGYSDSPRNRSYVIMNSVLYHLHPVKVK